MRTRLAIILQSHVKFFAAVAPASDYALPADPDPKKMKFGES